MGLKDLVNTEEETKTTTPEDEMEKLKNSMLVDSAVQGSFYYIFGSINTFMRLKGYEEIPPTEVFEKLKTMDSLTEEELRESDDPIHKFLLFYFYDEN